jgi:hypothetical protein
MAAVLTYLKHVRIIRESGIASDERSYYPALDGLFNAVGMTLTPKVVAIHDIADQGAGHPDYALQVEQTKDIRAAIEVKPPSDEVEVIMQSEQVRRYLEHYSLTLVTNLRDFALVRFGRNRQVEIIMRYTLAADEATFWRTSSETLARQHQEGLLDFLISVLTWDATITRPKDLADSLARYAREALRRLSRQPSDRLDHLREALSQALGLHFTDEQGEHFFRSSLVQTLFYSLFSAWVVWNRRLGGEEQFRWREAGDYLSLPVMRELFERIAIPSQLEMLDIRKPLEWAEATLRRTAWEEFTANFDQGDAVNYFYEPFLEAYDPHLREQLGVWYTPREIIRYQVARVDRLLREELQIPLGLADERVIVLDPATGTGGYILEVLRVIDATLEEQGWGAMRGMSLRTAATQRIFGFEILPAPFVVAHLQIATLLADRGASLAPQERAGVFLTNALTGWKREEIAQLVLPTFPALKSEAELAANVKQEKKILVVLGNPPYRGPAGLPEDEEQDLLAPYYVGLTERFGVQARGINDLYVRFFRLAERQIAEKTGRGIICYISNYSWLTGLSHPVMRERLLTAFDSMWIDNLHGDRNISERTPNGNTCETIFSMRGQSSGIKVGTAITTVVRKDDASEQHAEVFYRDVWGMPDEQATWGRAEQKRAALVWSATLSTEQFRGLYQPVTPIEAERFILAAGEADEAYPTWPLLPQIFPTSYVGVKTSRDEVLVSIDREKLEQHMRQYYDATLSDEQIAQRLPRLMEATGDYNPVTTRAQLLKVGFKAENIHRYFYRPMDLRWIYWEGTTKLLNRGRADFLAEVFPGNLFFEARQRQPKSEFDRTIVTPFLADNVGDGLSSYFPLWVRDRRLSATQTLPNINPALLRQLREAWPSEDERSIAESLFFHMVAITQSPLYRARNRVLLCRNWPRIPIPANVDAIQASASLGRRVADLLRPDVPFTAPAELRNLAVPTRKDGGQLSEADLRVTIRYGGIGRYEPPLEGPEKRVGRLWWNDVGYWNNVPAEIWSFTISGYPVIKKWLDYRHIEKLGRPLRYEEVRYVSEIVQRIAALIALGPSLDESYLTSKANTLEGAGVSSQAQSSQGQLDFAYVTAEEEAEE